MYLPKFLKTIIVDSFSTATKNKSCQEMTTIIYHLRDWNFDSTLCESILSLIIINWDISFSKEKTLYVLKVLAF